MIVPETGSPWTIDGREFLLLARVGPGGYLAEDPRFK